MKSLYWSQLTEAERDRAVAKEFNVEPAWDEQVGPPFSTSLDACFKLAKTIGVPLYVNQEHDGDVYACVYSDLKSYGKIPPSEAACLALMASRSFELAVKVI